MTDTTDTIRFIIQAGRDGGLCVYETLDGEESKLVFAGNLEEFTNYANKRAGEMVKSVAANGKPESPLHAVEQLRAGTTYRPISRVERREFAMTEPDGNDAA